MAAVFSSTTQVKSNWMKLLSLFSQKTKEAAIEDSYVTCNPTFYFDDKVEDKYKWVLKENFFARGRFGRDEDDVLYVQYYVYVVR